MRSLTRILLVLAVGAAGCLTLTAQCPQRPNPDTVVQDAPSIYSQNGVLKADLGLGHSVDSNGYTHYCYTYQTSSGVVEAPTLRLNPGDRLLLRVKDNINGGSESVSAMDMPMSASTCGDGGKATLNSTNVHFHGLNVPPTCHQDDVLTTLIQPGGDFQFDIQIPANEPPGLYWYHPHVHGFTEFQVNGGAAGAIVIEGMDKVRPEVAGLTERVFTIRQQFLVPWVPGPYELTFNFQQAGIVQGPAPIINIKPGEKQFWRVLNATLQDFLPLQFWVNDVAQPLELIALDGYPLAKPRRQTTFSFLPLAARNSLFRLRPRAPMHISIP
jgi:FtsP/CotA-like multicopper oxidase with cupredoxin domain